jgi:hypothetical protein
LQLITRTHCPGNAASPKNAASLRCSVAAGAASAELLQSAPVCSRASQGRAESYPAR